MIQAARYRQLTLCLERHVLAAFLLLTSLFGVTGLASPNMEDVLQAVMLRFDPWTKRFTDQKQKLADRSVFINLTEIFYFIK
jgi:hypothetical protein